MAGSTQAGTVDVAGHKSRREAERTHGLDHQNGEVAATPTIESQGGQRILDARLRPPAIGEALLDGVGERHQKLTRACWSSLMNEPLNPTMNLMVGIEILPQ